MAAAEEKIEMSTQFLQKCATQHNGYRIIVCLSVHSPVNYLKYLHQLQLLAPL